jgi:hypothetical protein
VSIHITKNRIRATGRDANGLFIAMASGEQLLKWESEKTRNEDFQRMVKEAIAARNMVIVGVCAQCQGQVFGPRDLFGSEGKPRCASCGFEPHGPEGGAA